MNEVTPSVLTPGVQKVALGGRRLTRGCGSDVSRDARPHPGLHDRQTVPAPLIEAVTTHFPARIGHALDDGSGKHAAADKPAGLPRHKGCTAGVGRPPSA